MDVINQNIFYIKIIFQHKMSSCSIKLINQNGIHDGYKLHNNPYQMFETIGNLMKSCSLVYQCPYQYD